MQCPICAVDLLMSEKKGVEIDYCPKCRGVWLDRGELEKIIELSVQPYPQQAPGNVVYAAPGQDRYYQEHDKHRGHHGHHDEHGRRRKSFLEDLFD